MGIYVETFIKAPFDEVWEHTQNPKLHQRWDLRFTDIDYLPKAGESDPQRFLYKTRIGFGMAIAGEGESVGVRHDENGAASSALKFWSDDNKSLIKTGSGYWKYVQHPEGVQFFTWYDYETRFGILGKIMDGILFRPLIWWATAWSFDCLRRWVESDISPEDSIRNTAIYAVSRLAICFVWIYHGLVPKLLFHHHDEVRALLDAGFLPATIPTLLNIAGCMEIAIGLLLILFWRNLLLVWLTIFAMLVALAFISINSPQYLPAAFNPISLNTCMIALSTIVLLSRKNAVSASCCKLKEGTGDAKHL